MKVLGWVLAAAVIAGCAAVQTEGRLKHVYDGNTLFDYIDGEADVYVKAGMEKTEVWEVKCRNYPLVADVYFMKDAQAAKKVFASFAGERKARDTGGIMLLFDGYQTIAAKGRLFLRVKPAPGGGSVPKEVQESVLEWVLQRKGGER